MTQSHALAHPLRKLIIAAFFPGLILSSVDAGLAGPDRIAGFPALVVTAVVSACLVFPKRRGEKGEYTSEAGRRRRSNRDFWVAILLVVYDVFFAAGLLAFLIVTWVFINRRWSHGQSVLSAYATMPYLLVCFIHAYLALLNLINLFDQSRYCPRCDGHLCSETPSIRAVGAYQDPPEDFQPLSQEEPDHDEHEEPGRFSGETNADEDARLIGPEDMDVVGARDTGKTKDQPIIQIV